MKKICLILSILMVLTLCACGTSETKGDEISLEEFNSIENGMTYEQVCEIVGSEGTVQSTASSGEFTMTMYTWKGNGDITSNANVTFTNDEVSAKAQLGLK